MKKLAKLTFIFIAIFFITLSSKVYAASLDCNIEIQTPKAEYAKGEEFTANVYVSNIQSEKGILALSAFLNYDKDSLNLLEMSGKNTWDTPAKDVSYNESTGKMVLLRDSLGKNNEVIFEMKFQVKQDSDASALIALNEITVANGIDDSKSIASVDKSLIIKEASTNPPNGDNQGDNNNGGNNNQGGNNNGGSDNNGGNNNNGSNNNGGNSNSGNNGGSSNNNNNQNNNSGNKYQNPTSSSDSGTIKNITTESDKNGNTIKNTNNNDSIGNTNTIDKASTKIPKAGVSYMPIIVGLIIILIIAIIYCCINMKFSDKYNR